MHPAPAQAALGPPFLIPPAPPPPCKPGWLPSGLFPGPNRRQTRRPGQRGWEGPCAPAGLRSGSGSGRGPGAPLSLSLSRCRACGQSCAGSAPWRKELQRRPRAARSPSPACRAQGAGLSWTLKVDGTALHRARPGQLRPDPGLRKAFRGQVLSGCLGACVPPVPWFLSRPAGGGLWGSSEALLALGSQDSRSGWTRSGSLIPV